MDQDELNLQPGNYDVKVTLSGRHSAKGLSKTFDNSVVAVGQIFDIIGVEA